MSGEKWEHISSPVDWIMDKIKAPRIAAIPTKYVGVQFRSRLEARWAAFLDLSQLKWEYEPMDFFGWTPDFLIQPIVAGASVDIYAEVKPLTEPSVIENCYAKAVGHRDDMWVLLLGAAPLEHQIGVLLDPPASSDGPDWSDVNATLSGYDLGTWLHTDHRPLWREAGNRVQWRAPEVAE